MKRPEKKLILESGEEFTGVGFGSGEPRVCEVVFNTSVVGYQEIISDPCYAGKFVVMTYPLIGNYGITNEDNESRTPAIGGLIVRECCDTPSNFRAAKTLEEELEEHGIPCLSGIDTRLLTKIIRKGNKPMGAIVDATMPKEAALALIASTSRPKDLVRSVSCKKRWVTRTSNHRFHVVAADCGIKHSVIHALNNRGCNVTIVPFNTPAKDIMAYSPDGVLLSDGPGAATEVPEIPALFAEIKGRVPVLGLGLGMEAIGLEYGAKLSDMGCGVHGDHPVRELASGRINIAVLGQSHCFKTVEGTTLSPTHTAVPEGYVLGFENVKDKVLGVQFHPESGPGPYDNISLFDRFIKMMEDNSNA
ncbi:MAG: carbamoyl phosphate synthase small subunit [Bacteroidales bacterium]|nr:carbamoyl phosphate synthase small subunit [Bacteroidales bacterium]